MSDVVESGPRGSGRGWVVGGIAAAALVAGLLRAGNGSPSDAPSESPTPVATVSSDPDHDPGPLPEETGPPLPVTLFTRRWTGPHDPLLLAFGARILRDPAGDDETPYQIGGVGSRGARLLPVTGGTVVLDSSGEDEMPPANVAVSFVRSGSREVVDLGATDGAVQAAEPSSVWLVDGRYGQPGGRVRMRRVDVRSGRVRQRVTLPPDTYPIAGVATGIVLRSTNEPEPSDDSIWSPPTGKVVWWLGGTALDWTARKVVVRDHTLCLRRCVRVFDVLDGTATPVDDLDGMMSGPSLSPDGAWVAVFVATGREGEMRLHVTNLSGGDTEVVSDTELGWHVVTELAWSRDSHRVYVSTSSGEADGQIAMWDLGSRQIGVLRDGAVRALATE